VRRALAALAIILPLGGLALSPAPAVGAALTLDEHGRREALRVGEKSVGTEAFDTEWKVKSDRGDSVSVLTPFHRLVIAARHATYSGKPLKPTEPDKLLKENRDRLVLLAELHGKSESFARGYAPRLVVGDREIKPTFVQNERTAQRQDDGRYLARCVYGFPIRDINGRGQATLIVADADGRDVSRFAIDLGKMR
jgi:hypothetical protein